jgi:PEP-CTERM motif
MEHSWFRLYAIQFDAVFLCLPLHFRALSDEEKMTKRAIIAFVLSVLSSLSSVSPAFPALLCQDVSTAGTVCAGASAGITYNSTTTTSSPNPSTQAAAASATETAAGSGGTTAIASASVGFGEAHLLGQVDLPAQIASTGFIAGLAFASFTDQITVGNADVNATFTSIIEGTFRTFQGNTTGGGAGGSATVLLYDVTGGDVNVLDLESLIGEGNNTSTRTGNVNLIANHTYTLFDKMEADATLTESPSTFGFPDEHSAVADLSNTGLLFIDTSGGSLSFLSGHDYSTDAIAAVPEPSTWAMLVLGFMGLGFLAYRRPSISLRVA